MKPKRILLIIPEMSMGGAQRSLSNLSLELARYHQVWLAIFNKNDGIAYPYGGKLICLDVIPRAGVFQKLKSFMQRVARLRKLKRELGIEVSISFLEGADYVNILSKSTDKIVLSIRGSKRYDERMVGAFFLLRHKCLIPWLYRRADAIVTVNHGIANELLIYYGLQKSRIVTIGNFYNVSEITSLSFEPKNENLKRLYQHTVLIVTGRLAPEKGLKSLILVFHGLKQKMNDLRLIMLGDGPSLNELVTTCKGLGLIVHQGSDFIDLPDVVLVAGEQNVFKYLNGAALYLMNSSSEGFPSGLAEAMICQVPVVSSDCPYGPREILAPEFQFLQPVSEPYHSRNGILMPMIHSENDIHVWVETLHAILGKRELLTQLTVNARDRINSYDRELITPQWYKILENDI